MSLYILIPLCVVAFLTVCYFLRMTTPPRCPKCGTRTRYFWSKHVRGFALMCACDQCKKYWESNELRELTKRAHEATRRRKPGDRSRESFTNPGGIRIQMIDAVDLQYPPLAFEADEEVRLSRLHSLCNVPSGLAHHGSGVREEEDVSAL